MDGEVCVKIRFYFLFDSSGENGKEASDIDFILEDLIEIHCKNLLPPQLLKYFHKEGIFPLFY